MAAQVTVLSVKASARPADADHPCGHGKVESLSALFETFLLLLTCGWIFKEACARLILHASTTARPGRPTPCTSAWFSDVIIQVDPVLTMTAAHPVAEAVEG